MIITCEACDRRFKLDESLLKPTGSKVQCSKCRHIFMAYPETDRQAAAAAGMQATRDSGPPTAATESMDDLTWTEADDIFGDETATEDTETLEDFQLDMDDLGSGILDEPQTDADIQIPSSLAGEESDAEGEELDLSDLESMLGIDEEAEAPSVGAELEGAQIDFTDVAENEKSALVAEGIEDLGEINIDALLAKDENLLEAEFALVGADAAAAEAGAWGAPEALFETGEAAAEVESGKGVLTEETEEMDLSDIEEMLELDETVSADQAIGETTEEPELELDLFDEGPSPGEARAPADEVEKPAAGETVSEEPDLELDLFGDLTAESETPSAADETESVIDELDLSDIEELIDDEAAVSGGAAGDEIENLDLDFDLSDEKVQMEEPAAEEPMAETEDLDLTDIEKMLDIEGEEESAAAPSPAAQEDELDFDLNLDLDSPGAPPSVQAQEQTKELDPAEIEAMLATGETPAPKGKDAEQFEELDLDMGDTSAEGKIEEEFGLEEFDFDEDLEIDDKTITEELPDTGDIELEFEVEEGDEVEEASAAESAEPSDIREPTAEPTAPAAVPEKAVDEYTATYDMGVLTGETESETAERIFAEEKPRPPKRYASRQRSRWPLALLIAVILLAGVLVGGAVVLKRMDIEIPYVNPVLREIPYVRDLIGPQAVDAGNLKMRTEDINSKFINNAKAGRLFVITGKVVNGYPEPRTLIKMTGKLYIQGRKMVQSQTVYAGNVVSDLDLTNNGLTAIQSTLKKMTGTAKVAPGGEAPFLVVFDKIPDNLEEYTLEVESSVVVR